MNRVKFLLHVIALAAISLFFVGQFYVLSPGFSNSAFLTKMYNGFSGIIILASIVLYAIALNDAYAIRGLVKSRGNPYESKKLQYLWNLYSATFLSGTDKTTTPAELYFNAEDIIAVSARRISILAILKALPGTFTGLGILGTFMGFSVGLMGFDTTTSDSMQKSVRDLLARISHAF